MIFGEYGSAHIGCIASIIVPDELEGDAYKEAITVFLKITYDTLTEALPFRTMLVPES